MGKMGHYIVKENQIILYFIKSETFLVHEDYYEEE